MAIEQVSGWKTSDGQLFGYEKAALEHEARLGLKKLGIFNEDTVKSLILWRKEVCDALGPLLEWDNKQPDATAQEKLAVPPMSETL